MRGRHGEILGVGPPRNGPDVLIIGAGIAGLTAADQLQRAGVSVVVAEGRGRVGGRILTCQPPGWPVPVDLGAEFVHGRSPPLLRALRRARVPVRDLHPPHHRPQGGRLLGVGRAWERALELSAKLDPGARTAATALKKADWRRQGTAYARRLARDYLEGFNAADLDRASVTALLQQQQAAETIDGERLARPEGGYGGLVQDLAERLVRHDAACLRLGTVVQQLVWRAGTVQAQVRAADGVPLPPLRARLALITVPLGVLQARPPAPGAIHFVPALPRPVKHAIGRLAMGGVTKVILRLRRSAWQRLGRRGLGFLHNSGAAFPTLWTLREGARPIIVAWAAGPATERLPTGEARLRRTAVATLGRALGLTSAAMESQVDDALICPWAADPLARGGYSYVPAGAEDSAAVLARPIADRLIFAGEATETHGHGATVHGALMTGQRAAADALAILRG